MNYKYSKIVYIHIAVFNIDDNYGVNLFKMYITSMGNRDIYLT